VRSALTAAATVLLLLPGVASATFIPGPSGKIVFASGRGNSDVPSPADNDDNNARLWVADSPFGTPVQLTTDAVGTQHRHPNWSPDHKKVVYAAGVAFNATGTYALYIKDLVTGQQTLFAAAAAGQDRPTWSPDGTRIAYGSGGKIMVKGVAPGSTAQPVTNGTNDERAVWSPDGNTLYFNRGPKYIGPPGSGDKAIYKLSPVSLSATPALVVNQANIDDWQPAVSPDGQELCFLRGPQSNGADLWMVSVAGVSPAPFSAAANGDLNCVWSPDGTRVLYTLGAFDGGDLALREVSGDPVPGLNAINVDHHFDGNADWATNFSPTCDAKAASTAFNSFVSIGLSCTDPDAGFGAAPPAPEPLDSSALEIVDTPKHGNIGALSDGKLIYTPAKDFTGTDTFTYKGNDGTSDSKPATVTVQVAGAGGGGGGGMNDRTAPSVSKITLSRTRWRRGNALPSAARAKVGMTIGFGLDEAGTARIAFGKAKPGRRVGGKCVKPTKSNRARRACTRFVAAGSFTIPARLGTNTIRFQGRLDATHRLGLGRYRVSVSATDAAGNTSKPATGPSFKIVRR
jgi:hypothetical protein